MLSLTFTRGSALPASINCCQVVLPDLTATLAPV